MPLENKKFHDVSVKFTLEYERCDAASSREWEQTGPKR